MGPLERVVMCLAPGTAIRSNVYNISIGYTLSGRQMRTNIVIDDDLMDDVLKATGLKTKREAVELGLKILLRLRRQEQIKSFRGKLKWEGDLEAMRADS